MVNHYLDCFLQTAFYFWDHYYFFFLKNQECIRAMSIILEGKAKSQSGMRTKGGEYKSAHSLTGHKNQQVKEKRFINNTRLFSSVWLLSHVRILVIPWIAAHQASLSITNSQSPPKPISIERVMPSNHLIFCHPLLLLPPIPPSIRVFSHGSGLRIRWPKYWSFSFNISPSNKHSGLISLGWTGWISLQSKGLSRVFSNTTLQKYQFFSTQLSLYPSLTFIHDY